MGHLEHSGHFVYFWTFLNILDIFGHFGHFWTFLTFFFLSRRECAYNFPAMVIFVGPSSFVESLYSTFAGLAADPVAKVRKTLASSLHELAKLVGTSFNTTKVQIVRLFHGKKT